MGLIPDIAAETRVTDSARAEQAPGARRSSLRVVMVVANDVTRDSRVLREAAVLAANGHRVTILGIMTARTVAPEVELREGFVIRRLRYRARPPRWWIPPDFYGRVRYRSERQYRIHRARVIGLVRQARRQLRLTTARFRSVRPADFPSIRSSLHRRELRPRSDRGIGGRFSMATITEGTRQRARRARSMLRRARRAPAEAWLRKSREGFAEARRGAGRLIRRVRRPRYPTSRARGLTAATPSRLRSLFRQVTGTPIRMGRAIGRGLNAWVSIMGLLAWGSLYLLANRVTHGAIEWQTGWRWRWLGWARYVVEEAPDADVWHGHDMTSLPAIVELKRARGGFAIYDSHEVYLESGRHAEQPRWAKSPLESLERRLVAEVDAVVTVNRSVAEILKARLAREEIEVLYNCPPRASGPMRGSRLRRRLGLSRTTPLLLYHGSLAPHRGIEQLLEAIQRSELADAHLAFLGFGSMTEWLRTEVRHARFGGRVHLLDAVPPDELPSWLHGVDVAVAPIQASTLNHRNSSPNKVFEAIAAGTPVAGSNFAEFRRVIEDPVHGPLGTVFDPASPADIARAVRQLLDAPPAARAALRRRCRTAASRRWNWETESLALVGLYQRLGHERAAGRPATGARVA